MAYKTVNIDKKYWSKLNNLSDKSGFSIVELIRKLIDLYLDDLSDKVIIRKGK